MKEQYRDTDVAKKMYFTACSGSFSEFQPANFHFPEGISSLACCQQSR